MQCVVERTQIRVDFLAECAGQKAQSLTGFHRGPGENDAVHALGLQCLHRLGHRQIGLAGTGRAQTEHDGVGVDGVDVALLVERLGPDGLSAPREDVEGQDVGG